MWRSAGETARLDWRVLCYDASGAALEWQAHLEHLLVRSGGVTGGR